MVGFQSNDRKDKIDQEANDAKVSAIRLSAE